MAGTLKNLVSQYVRRISRLTADCKSTNQPAQTVYLLHNSSEQGKCIIPKKCVFTSLFDYALFLHGVTFLTLIALHSSVKRNRFTYTGKGTGVK